MTGLWFHVEERKKEKSAIILSLAANTHMKLVWQKFSAASKQKKNLMTSQSSTVFSFLCFLGHIVLF